jgi:adenylate kinase
MKLLMIAAPGGRQGHAGRPAGREVRRAAHLVRGRAGAPRCARVPGRPAVAAFQQRGDLVPDAIVFELLTPVVSAAAARGGYILDGFPRTVPQAMAAADLGRRLDLTLDARRLT